MSDDLFPRLRRMWERRDPVPDSLVESVLVALETADLDYELLTLVDSTDRLAGVRGTGAAVTLTFTAGTTTVMLRVAPLSTDRRRIDGWLSPPVALTVRLDIDAEGAGAPSVEQVTESSPEGRFEFADVPTGEARMWLEPRLATGSFEL